MNQLRTDEHLLAVLHNAARRGDDETYLATLLDISLVMPAEPGGDDWAVAPTGDSIVLVVFSSVELMRASPVGGTVPFVVWPVLDLVHAWPDPKWSLLIDGTLDTQVQVEPDAIEQLAASATQAYPLDAALRTAAGHPRSYLEALIGADVIVAMRPKGSASRDLANPAFAWWHTGDAESGAAVALFSSPVRLQATLGDIPWLVAPFTAVLSHWPDGCAAVVDPGHRNGMSLPAEAMAGMDVALALAPTLIPAGAN